MPESMASSSILHYNFVSKVLQQFMLYVNFKWWSVGFQTENELYFLETSVEYCFQK